MYSILLLKSSNKNAVLFMGMNYCKSKCKHWGLNKDFHFGKKIYLNFFFLKSISKGILRVKYYHQDLLYISGRQRIQAFILVPTLGFLCLDITQAQFTNKK